MFWSMRTSIYFFLRFFAIVTNHSPIKNIYLSVIYVLISRTFIMVMSCSAFGCQNRFNKDSNIRFHAFPKDPERRKKWIQAVRRVNFQPTAYDKICSEHFLPSDYRQGSNLTLKLLNNDAVPSVFPAFPSHMQPPAKRRRLLERVSDVAAEVEIPFQQHDDVTDHVPLLNASEQQVPNLEAPVCHFYDCVIYT